VVAAKITRVAVAFFWVGDDFKYKEIPKMDKVKEFYQALAKDEKLQKAAMALNAKAKDGMTEDETLKLMIEFASANGYDITPNEIKTYLGKENAADLSDDALEEVAGGVCILGGGMGKCFCLIGGGGSDSDLICVFLGYSNSP
jgi:predicted ribosomally synthesized peptide with nif11-like leader